MPENKSPKINVVDEFGEIYNADPSELQSLTQQGFRPATQEEVEKEKLREKYGTGVDNALKAVGQGAAKSIPVFGGAVLKGFGVTPEIEKVRSEEFPGSEITGQIAGTLGQLALPGGPLKWISQAGKGTEAAVLGATAAKTTTGKVLERVAAKGLGSALEGGLYGIGNVINEATLGDPNLTYESAMAEIGNAALWGGVAGVALSPIDIYKDRKLLKQVEEAAAKEHIGSVTDDYIKSQSATAGMGIKDKKLESVLKEAIETPFPEEALEKPTKKAAMDAAASLKDLQHPPDPIQLQALGDQATAELVDALEVSGSDIGEQFRAKKTHQKAEWVSKLKDTVKGMVNPGSDIVDNERKAGQRAVKLFIEKDTELANKYAPLWEKFDKELLNPIEYPGEIIGRLENALPGISNYLDFDGVNGKVSAKYWDTGLKYGKDTFKAVKHVLSAVNEEEPKLGNLRNALSQISGQLKISPGGAGALNPQEMAHVGRLKNALLDYVAETAEKNADEPYVKQMFKDWGTKQKSKEAIEKILGAPLQRESGRYIVSDDVLDKIFRNGNNVADAKVILGNDFNTIAADYLHQGIKRATDNEKNIFSSAKFATFLKDNENTFLEAFSESPGSIDRVKNLTTILKLLPDSPPMNLSGTAKTKFNITEVAKKLADWTANPVSGLKDVGGWAFSKAKQASELNHNLELANEIRKGMSYAQAEEAVRNRISAYSVLRPIEDARQKTLMRIASGIKNVFKDDAHVYLGAELGVRSLEESRKKREKDYVKIRDSVTEVANNPDLLMNRISERTSPLFEHAPNITGGMQTVAVRAVQYLNANLPQEPMKLPLSADWVPSQSEINKFMRRYEAVEDPLSTLRSIKSGTLTQEAVDAFQAVHPTLYDTVKSELVDRITDKKKPIPYKTRLMLSMFLQQPLDASLKPTTVLSNQAVYNSPIAQAPIQQGSIRPTQGGMQKLNLAERSLTPMQKSNQRNQKS